MSVLEDLFALQLNGKGETTYERQCKQPYRRATERNKRSQPRADFCFPVERVVIEIQGNTWAKEKHGHTNGAQYDRDVRKLNDAGIDGWLCLWFTTDMVMKTEEALNTTLEALERRRNEGHDYSAGGV